MKKILTVGVYDLLHLGHVLLFKHAKEYGDYLIVAVQESENVLKYKPEAEIINTTEERLAIVASIRYVDKVITYNDVDKDIKKIDFDVFVKGPDQNHSGFQEAVRWCQSHGKEVVVIPRTEGISSSILRDYIKNESYAKN